MEHVNTREARGVLTVRIAVDMKIDVVVASISCLGKFPTNHGDSTQTEAITGCAGGRQKIGPDCPHKFYLSLVFI